jgi:hypothetical protein
MSGVVCIHLSCCTYVRAARQVCDVYWGPCHTCTIPIYIPVTDVVRAEMRGCSRPWAARLPFLLPRSLTRAEELAAEETFSFVLMLLHDILIMKPH